MKTDKELFDEAVQSCNLGRRLPDDAPDRFDGGLQQYLNYAQEHIEHFRQSNMALPGRPLPQIMIDYTDQTSVNAVAFNHDGKYVIAVSIGAMRTLSYLFWRLLSDRNVLPSIGDVRNEFERLPNFQVSANWSELEVKLQTAGHAWINLVMPKDPVRRGVANLMVNNAITFLLGHEFRHIQAGHVDFGENVLALSSLGEMNFITDRAELGLRRQALELDADSFALAGILTRAVWELEHISQLDGFMHEIFKVPDKLMTILLWSCSGLFRILDPYGKSHPSDWDKLSHPPSRIRRLMLLGHADTFLEREGQRPLFHYPDVGNREFVQLIEPYVENVWGSPYDESYSRLALSEGPKHISKIKSVAKTIGPELRKYSYVYIPNDYYF